MEDILNKGVISSDLQTHKLEKKLAEFKSSAQSDGDKTKLREAAQEFEAIFISQMLQPMMNTVETDSLFGGGNSEKVYQSMMVDEVGKAISKNGGIGIADQVYQELLKIQEGNE